MQPSTPPKEGTKEYEALRTQAIAETIADMMLLIATTMRAIPESTESLSALQSLLARLMTVSLGPDWAEQNDAVVTKAIEERLKATKAEVIKQTETKNARQA